MTKPIATVLYHENPGGTCIIKMAADVVLPHGTKLYTEEADASGSRAVLPEAGAFLDAALRFAKAHVESDRLDRHDDVEHVQESVYKAADAEYNASKAALVKAYKRHTMNKEQ